MKKSRISTKNVTNFFPYRNKVYGNDRRRLHKKRWKRMKRRLQFQLFYLLQCIMESSEKTELHSNKYAFTVPGNITGTEDMTSNCSK